MRSFVLLKDLSTVAMITAVGVVAPIALASNLSYHPVYIAIAIGYGSKPISWMNDSGFWVISKMSGMTEFEMLKTNTIMGIIMALTGLIVCLIGSESLSNDVIVQFTRDIQFPNLEICPIEYSIICYPPIKI